MKRRIAEWIADGNLYTLLVNPSYDLWHMIYEAVIKAEVWAEREVERT